MPYRQAALSIAACILVCTASWAQIIPKSPSAFQVPSGTGACSLEKSCADLAPYMIRSALGPSSLPDNLRHLTNDIGGRLTGSAANERAVAWAVDAFHRAGIADVKTESFTLPVTWSEGATRLTLLTSSPFSVRLVSVGWSPATPAGGITANIIDVGPGDASGFATAGPLARGSIVFVHQKLMQSVDDLLGEYTDQPAIIDRAASAGAAAILWMSDRPGLLLYRHTSTPGSGTLEKLPQAIVARDAAEKIAQLLALGRSLRATLDMPNRISGPTTVSNVVAEIRGRENPDEFVVLGAHLDSWDLGTGALDNAAGDAVVIDSARVIHSSGSLPRCSIRFVLFNGEEQVFLGSRAYIQAHYSELDKMVAAVVFDSGDGAVTGYSVCGRKDAIPALRDALDPLKSLGITGFSTDAAVETDNFDFLLEGIPTFLPNQDMANYLPSYHASSDTLDKVNVSNLKKQSAIAAITAYAIADSPRRIAARQSRAEVEQLLHETGLDQQMQLEGFWPDWQNHRRGRQ